MKEAFIRNKELPRFFGEINLIGEKRLFDISLINTDKPELFYKHPNGEIWIGDSITWLNSLPKCSVDLIFADPPYNIKKADWDNFESQKKYIEWSLKWIEPASKILKSTGTLYICGFSEILADLKAPSMKFFKSCRWIIWNYKNKANLGKDWGRSHESILLFRKSNNFTFNIDSIRIPYSKHTLKYPDHPQALTSQYGNGKNHIWKPSPNGAKPQDVMEIPTTCNGMHEKTPHPTQKPEELLRKIILASSNIGDTVLDPFLGSGTTAVASEQLKRKWIGCDFSREYLEWAINRIELVEYWEIEKWIKYDYNNMLRRKSIR
ncbi:site-specific DNA-methyltransferase [bacterium]|nr:site-specific DNA-methyltransferase [bacterium]